MLSSFATSSLRSPAWSTIASSVIPADSAFSVLYGSVPVRGGELPVRVAFSPFSPGNVKESSLHLPDETCAALAARKPALRACLSQSQSLPEVLEELAAVAASAALTAPPTSSPATTHPEFYSGLLGGLRSLGWHRVVRFEEARRSLTLAAEDSRGRVHHLTLTLPAGFPEEKPLVTAALPEPFNFEWFTSSTLLTIFLAFQQKLEAYCAFWDVLDDIDSHTWVLDPDPGPLRRSAAYRRIAVGKYSWIQLTISWRSPRSVCECQFVGAEAVVAPLRKQFTSNVSRWDESLMARENIEALLGLTLPVSSATATDEVTVECGVCYTYKLPKGVGEPGEFLTPDFRCEADACGRAFHTSCLVEWLTAIPTTRKSFGMLFGQCPYCQQTINITC